MRSADVVIAGAGLIGMACALECSRRGLHPVLLERGEPGREASWAAAGMLAAHDPANPLELQALADRSIALYPEFLQALAQDSDLAVPLETEWTLEAFDGAGLAADAADAPAGFEGSGFHGIPEHSLDPRKLAAALHAAVRARGIALHTHTEVLGWTEGSSGVLVQTSGGAYQAHSVLDCTGAWSAMPVLPAKGQMLRVHAPGAMRTERYGNVVVRNAAIYLVPRLDGSVVIGATVEHAGFDKTVHTADLADLRRRAAALLPALANAAEMEHWAGLRPDTPDHLPLLGATGPRAFVAAGHFRNGVLLAPATAEAMTQCLLGEIPAVDLAAFDPGRFSTGISAAAQDRPIFAQPS